MANKHGVIHYNNWDNSYIPNILKEIYLDRVYEPYLSYIKNNVVLDLGMNISLWSLYASQFAKQVYGFEPAATTFALAFKNIKDNDKLNITPYQKAVSTEDGEMTLYHNTNSTMNSLNQRVSNLPELAERVETVRLDTFMKLAHIDHIGFAKIDVEGFESKLFTSDSFANIAPKLDALVYEWHSWADSNPNVINSCLSDLGFTNIRQIPCDATVFGCTK